MMLNYEEQFGWIECLRPDGDRVAHLYYCDLGRYVTQDLNCTTTSDELRQVADKLDELNGIKSINDYRKGFERYEKLRKLNPRQFEELYLKNISGGENFDELVDGLFDKNE